MKSLFALTALTVAIATMPAQTVSFTAFGRPCGGDLAGTTIRSTTGTLGIRLDVTNAAPGSVAVLVLGGQQRGVQLPGSNCMLLVNPRGTQLAQVDRSGAAAFRFQLPPRVPAHADAQVVTVGLSRAGRIAESTNGLTIDVR